MTKTVVKVGGGGVVKVCTAELVESLIALAGSVERAATWIYVTPSAVSTWRRSGGMSQQSEKLVRRVLTRYRTRSAFLSGWLYQRTTGRGKAFAIVVETVAGDGMHSEPDGILARTITSFGKEKREAVIYSLTVSYLTHDLIVDGDVLVFADPEVTEFVYLDSEDVAVSFNRREYEPWWALRGLIRTGKKVT